MKLRQSRISLAIQGALMLAMLPLAAQAQDTTTTDTKTLDTVTVTGTRIKKSEVESQVPVQVLTREDIDRSGLTSLGDLVQELTSSGSALNTKFNSSGNFGFSPNGDGVGAGSAQVDLRHLGSKRVLVLVDGLRWVNESSASGVGASTDLNTIPMALVERIEVLQDGASALYGSDAIAGVINIITRKNFDGGQVSAQYGVYGEGDGDTKSVDLAWGWNTDRSNLFLGLSWVDQDAVFSKDREQSSFPIPGTGLAFASSATPNGRFIFFSPVQGSGCGPLTDHDNDPATPDMAFCNITTPNGSTYPNGVDFSSDFIRFTRANRFNFAQYNMLVTPSERTGLFGQYRFNISDNLQWYAKALWNRRESTNQAAPEPIFLGPDAGTGNPYADNITISALNPFNPFGIDLGPSNLILVGRRPVEGGPRVFEQDVDTQYIATGLSGVFGADGRYLWDANVTWSRNEADQTNYGSYNIRNIALALGDPAACAAVAGCTPLNIFDGPGSITPAMLAWIQPVLHDSSSNELFTVSANVSGEAWQMPAGPLAFAVGVEHRRYEGEYTPDPLNYVEVSPGVFENWYNGVPSLPTKGDYNVSELYFEANAPLIDDGEGQKLDVSLAGRYSDYSTFGSEFTPKVGLRWQLVPEFTVRATYAEGFRAPSIGELFGSASRADLVIDDPCLIGVDGSAPTGDPATCAALGVPAGAAQSNAQISVQTGGNPNLDPETARSFTAGFVWSPSFATSKAWSDKVDIDVTYFRYDIEGAIQAIDAQTQLDLCVAESTPTSTSPFCDGITRSSVGSINGFANRLTNLGAIKTSGLDANLSWTWPETVLGKVRVSWQNTFVTEYRAVGAGGDVQPRAPGIEVNDSGIPEWTMNAILDWTRGPWFGSWTVRHISELEEDCGDAAGFPGVCSDDATSTNVLNATTFNDVRVGYKFDWMKGFEVTAGVNNVFNQYPPECLSCSLNGYDASTYDPPGSRFYYLRMSAKF